MTDDKKEAEKETILLVYVGSRLGGKDWDKLVDLWLVLTPEQFEAGELPSTNVLSDHYRSYSGKEAKRHMRGSPGGTYEVPQNKGTTVIWTSDARYRGLWPDQEQRTKWQIDHRTAVTTVDLRKQAKKESAADHFAVLEPFKKEYDRLIFHSQRAALLAQVIAYITS